VPDRRARAQGRRDRSQSQRLPYLRLREREGLSLHHRKVAREPPSRTRKGAVERGAAGLVAGRPGRSEPAGDEDRARAGGDVERAGKLGGAAFEFARARLTGTKPNLGEKRKVTVEID